MSPKIMGFKLFGLLLVSGSLKSLLKPIGHLKFFDLNSSLVGSFYNLSSLVKPTYKLIAMLTGAFLTIAQSGFFISC